METSGGHDSLLVDAELLARVSGGDREAAGRLVEGLWPDAYRIARMVTQNSQTAEDAAQSACIEMLNSLPKLRDPASFRSWFFRLVTRAAYRENRRSGWQELVGPLPDQTEATPEHGDLHAAIWSLNPRERLVLVLHYHYGYHSHEISSMLGTSAGTVRYVLWKARRTIKRLLTEDKEGGSSESV